MEGDPSSSFKGRRKDEESGHFHCGSSIAPKTAKQTLLVLLLTALLGVGAAQYVPVKGKGTRPKSLKLPQKNRNWPLSCPPSGVVFEGMCPVPECYCGLDIKGRMEVDCSSGGLNEIPTSRMSPDIEVIRITSPKGRANHLTIGRTFRQFRSLKELHIVSLERKAMLPV